MAVRYSPAFRKVAGPVWDAFKSTVTSPGVVIPAAFTVAGAGANMMRDVIGDAIEAKRKAEAYKAMVAAHPTLKGKPEKELRSIYNSVYNINPHMAKDPLVAGAIIDRIYTRQGMHGGSEATSNQGLLETAQELSGIRQSVSGAMKSEADRASRGRVDFQQIGATFGGQLASNYSDLMKEHGEAAAARKQLADYREASRVQTIKDVHSHFKSRFGVEPSPEAFRAIGALTANPELAHITPAAMRRAVATARSGERTPPPAHAPTAPTESAVPSGLDRFRARFGKKS